MKPEIFLAGTTMDIHKLRAATPAPPSHSGSSPHAHAGARTAPIMPDPAGALAWCLAQHEAHHGLFPSEGGRNVWLTQFGLFCNERGVLLADLEAHALAYYATADFTEQEIRQTVGGIYRREAAAHGTNPYTVPRPQGLGNKPGFSADFRQKENQPPTELPATFPASVYDALPDFLQRACAPFEGHEKAVMLLGTLGVLSGCFPGVGGIYAGRRFGLNLFVFITAPAASGKGVMSYAQKLARPWHRRLLDENRLAAAQFAEDEAAHKAAGRNAGPAPVAPPRRLLFLPGDSTAAALIGALADNDGRGIIFENEADTLTTALGGEHGKFAEKLCKFFQHEPVTLIRKTDKLHIELERPAVSLVLSGTPGQVPRLMPNAENGLVSRFVFYCFAPPLVWKSAAPTGQPPLDTYFEPLAAYVSGMIAHAPALGENGELGAEITLSPEDWQRLDTWGAGGLAEAEAHASGAGASTAVRLGPIAFRLAGLLTVLRCFDNGEAPAGTLAAHAGDITTALALADVARAHALAVLAMLPAPGGPAGGRYATKAGQEARVRELHAQGLSVRAIADQTGIAKSTVDRWLT